MPDSNPLLSQLTATWLRWTFRRITTSSQHLPRVEIIIKLIKIKLNNLFILKKKNMSNASNIIDIASFISKEFPFFLPFDFFKKYIFCYR